MVVLHLLEVAYGRLQLLLEMTPRSLDDRTLVERPKLHLSFQKPGI